MINWITEYIFTFAVIKISFSSIQARHLTGSTVARHQFHTESAAQASSFVLWLSLVGSFVLCIFYNNFV